MQNKKYGGTVFIGVVGPETEIGECRDSIDNLRLRAGDAAPRFIRATKGYEARQNHIDYWINETQHPYALLLDHDMVFSPDTLERLRAHQLPYVSGYYLRRRYAPLAPVWFKLGPRGAFPMEPWSVEPERGKLHRLGASGWGCLLLHRAVVEAVRPLLKGEPEIAEDDLDVWPYDLDAVMRAVKGLQTLTTEKVSLATLRPALEQYAAALARELRPLRGSKDPVGSDIRFPFFAREAGFVLMGDPDVRPSHMLNYPLEPDDYAGQGAETAARLGAEFRKQVGVERRKIAAHVAALGQTA